MAYKVIVTENAAQQVENILEYIIYRLHNEEAAIEILNEIEETYNSLEYLADSMAFCYDRYLKAKGYRKISLRKHDYVILYQIVDDKVYVNGVFHMLENYRDKL